MNTKHIPTGLVVLGVALFAYSALKPSQKVEINTARQILNTVQSVKQNQLPQNVESLREAYTGKWFKNKPEVYQEAGQFQFNPPENTRNVLDTKKAADDKKKKEDLKKKQAKKKKLQAFKLAKKKAQNKKRTKSLFDYTLDDKGIPEFVYYPFNQNQNQKPNQQTQEEPEKKWTIDELFEIATSSNSIQQLTSLYKNSDINADIFYGVVERLFASSIAEHHTLAFSALTQTPSIASFTRHVSFLEEETDEQIRTTATTQLEIYKDITNLSVLNMGISTNERSVQQTSAVYLQQVAELLLQIQTNVDPERNPSSFTPRVLERYRAILRQSVNIMNNRINSGNLEPELLNLYTQSKTRIEQYLGTTPTNQNIAGF